MRLLKSLVLVFGLLGFVDAQTPDSVITDFDYKSTWGTGPGVADYRSSANHQSNALASIASAWVGGSAAGSYLYKEIDLDLEAPTIVKVRVNYRYVGGTVNYGFGSFSGISAIVGANGDYYQRDIDAGFEPSDIAEKLIALVGLFGFYPATTASSVGMLVEVVDVFGQIMEYTQLAQNLMDLGETKNYSTTFRFMYDPSIVNRIKVGFRANAAGALTGSGTAVICGQVKNIELYLRQSDGSWIATNPSQNHQWVEAEVSGFEEGYQWYDRKLDDISPNNHIGTYHPYSIVPGNDNYFYRHDYSMYNYMNSLILNSPYSGYSFVDEYISLNYNTSDLRTLERGGTLETWVKVGGSDYHRGHMIYLGDDAGGDGLGSHGEVHLSVNPDGRFEFYMGDDEESLHIRTDTCFVQLNQWYHLLVSYLNIDNRMEATLYVNGQAVATGSASGTCNPNLQQAHLGKPDANTRYFRGQLRGIHIRQEPYSVQKALMAYYRSGGDQTAPTIPALAGLPKYYAGNSVNIHWNKSTDTQSGVDYYRVRCENLTTPETVDSTSYTWSQLFRNLDNGATYQFSVQSVDSAGNRSTWSNGVTTTIDTIAPPTPAIQAESEYTPTDSNTIVWDPVSDDMDSVYYLVEICNNEGFNPYDSVNTTYYDSSEGWITESQYTFNGLSDEEEYYYRVIARDIAGNQSAWSDTVHSIQDHQKPYAPTLNPEPAHSAGDQNRVSWNPPPGDWSSLTYQVIASWSPDPENQYISNLVTETETTLYNLTNQDDSECYFFVRARNEFGVWSNWSDYESTIQEFDIPEPPIVDPLPTSVTTETIVITFQDDEPTNALDGITHQIRFADNRDFTNAGILSAGESYAPVFHFRRSDRRLYFQVRGLHDGHVGEWSNMVYTTYSPPVSKHDVYYVSPDGNDNIAPNLAMNPETGTFRTIIRAYQVALPGDTLKLMSGAYYEAMTLDKSIAITAYEGNSTPPEITKTFFDTDVIFTVTADHVAIRGLKFTGWDVTPIKLDNCQFADISENIILDLLPVQLIGAEHNTIASNRFEGQECDLSLENSLSNRIIDNRFLRGAGMELTGSHTNVIHGNTFSTFGAAGILVSGSDDNTLTGNRISEYPDYWLGELSAGIKIADDSRRNNISGNLLSMEMNAPILVANSSENLITGTAYSDNWTHHTKLRVSESSGNRFYYNRFLENYYPHELDISLTDAAGNQWQSPTRINYYPEAPAYSAKEFISNDYWGFSDDYRDISDTLDAWWFGKNSLHKSVVTQPGYFDTIPSASEIILASDSPALTKRQFEGSSFADKSWDGCLTFLNIPASTDSFTLEIGTAADSLGTGFVSRVPVGTFAGNDTSVFVTFSIASDEFTLSQGEHLAIRLRNNTSSDQILRTGGAWSYITSPLSNQSPVLASPVFSFNEDNTLTLTRDSLNTYITDPDAPDSLLTLAFGNHPNITIQQTADIVQFIPAPDFYGNCEIVWSAGDGEFTDSTLIQLDVLSFNDPPVIDSIPVVEINEMASSKTVTGDFLLAHLRDPDTPDDEISLKLESEEVTIFNGNVIIPPGYGVNSQRPWETYSGSFIVSDGEFSDTSRCIIRVNEQNSYTPGVSHYLSFPEDDTLTTIGNVAAYLADNDMFNPKTDELLRPESSVVIDTSFTAIRDSVFNVIFASSGEHLQFDFRNGEPVAYSTTVNYNGWDTLDVDIYDYYGEPHHQVTASVPVHVISVNDAPVISGLPMLEWAEDDTLDNYPVGDFYDYFTDDNPLEDIPFYILEGSHTQVYINRNTADYRRLAPENYSDDYAPAMEARLRFTSDENWYGKDTLRLKINDAQASPGFAEANLYVQVQPVNDAPDIGDEFFLTFFENDSLVCNLSGLESRSYDIETANDSLIYTINGGEEISAEVDGHTATFSAPANWNGLDTLSLIISDGELADTARMAIEVYPMNTPPEFTAIPEITFPEDSSIFYDSSRWYDYVEDAETPDTALYFYQLQSRGGHVSEGYEGHNTITADWNWYGTDTLIVKVIDESDYYDYLYSDTSFYLSPNIAIQEVVVHVTPVNDPPEVLLHSPTFILEEDDSCLVTATEFYEYVWDPESADSSLIYTPASGTNISVHTLTDSSWILHPNPDWFGVEYLPVTVSDGADSISGEFYVQALPVLDTLRMLAPDTVFAKEDQLFEADIEYSVDGASYVFFEMPSRPSWISLSGDKLTGRPTEGIEGDITLQLIGCQNPSIYDTMDVTFRVTAVNDPPYLFGNDTVSTSPGSEFSFTIHANDPDDSDLNYQVNDLPSWLTADSNYVSGTAPANPADTSFQIVVSDDEFADTARVTVQFQYFPMTPVVASPQNISGAEDQYFSYIFEAYDPAGGFPMTDYLYLPDWLSVNNDTLSGYPPEGVVLDSFTVAMYSMEADTVTLYINLESLNDPPVILSPKLVMAKEDSLFTYKIEATDPEDSTVTGTITDYPYWATVAGDSISGTPPEGVLEDHFIVTVTDGEMENSQYVQINIESVNDSPYLVSEDSVSVEENATLTYELSAADPEDSTVTARYITFPSWADTSDLILTGTPPNLAPDTIITALLSDGILADTVSITVDVIPVNDAPQFASAMDTVSCTEDILTKYTPIANDPDGDALVYTVLAGYPWIQWQNDTLHIIPEEGVLNADCRVIASDGALKDTLDLVLEITPVNDPPVLVSVDSFDVTDNDIFVYEPEATDPEDSTLTYFYSQLPVWLSTGGGGNQLTGRPYTDAPDISFTVFATDGELFDTLQVNLSVDATNDPPVITGPDVLYGIESRFFSYAVEVSDPEEDSLTFSFSGLEWLTAEDDSVFGYPPNGVTEDTFSIIVSDGFLSDSADYFLQITPVNDPPLFKLSVDTIYVTEHDSVNYLFDASDPDDGFLTYYYDNLPSWLAKHANRVTGIAVEGATSRSLAAYVTDRELTDTAFVHLYVQPVNDPPEFTSDSVISATENEGFSHFVEATDPEDSTLTIFFTQVPDWCDTSGATIFGSPTDGILMDSLLAIATDGVMSDTQQIVIEIEPVNDAPVITSPDSARAAENQLFTYQPTATDSDNVSLDFTCTGLPDWLEFNSGDTLITGTPGDNAQSTSFTVTVSDGELEDSRTIHVTLQSENDPPVITSLDTLSGVEGTYFSFQPAVSDPDDSEFSWEYLDYPGWCSAGDSLVGVPPEGELEFTFTAIVSDTSQSDSMVFTVPVTPVNLAPTFTSGSRLFLEEHETFRFAPATSDPEDSTLTITFHSQPPWISSDDTSCYGTVPEGADNAELTIIASDGELHDTLALEILVTPVNDPPYFTSDSVFTANEKSAVLYEATATDPEGSNMVWQFTSVPEWLTLADNALSGTAPSGADSGQIHIVASDGFLADTLVLRYEIIDINEPPVITSRAAVIATEDEPFVYRATGYDPDSSAVDFVFTGLPAWVTAGEDSLTGTPGEGTADTSFIIIARNPGDELADTLVVEMDFIPVNDPPIFLASFPDSLFLNEDDTLTIARNNWNTHISDDGDIAEIRWSVIQNRVFFNAAAESLSFYPSAEWFGTDVVEMLITDEGNLSDTTEMVIQVSAVNDPPQITGYFPRNINIAEDETLRLGLDSIFTDSDDALLSLDWDFHVPPEFEDNIMFTTDSLERELTIFAEADFSGEVSLSVHLTDPAGLEDSITIQVTVVPVNDPPVLTSAAQDSATEDIRFVYRATAHDPEDSTVTYTFSELPEWLTAAGDSISGTPTEGTGDTSFVVYASDGELSDSLTVYVTVIPVNDSPVITSPGLWEVTEGVPAEYTVTAEDAEDSTITVLFPVVPSWATDAENMLTGIPGEGAPDTIAVIVATDGQLSDTLQLTISVESVNNAPEFISAQQDTAYEDIQFSYIPTVVDPEDSTLTYSYLWYPNWLEIRGDTLMGIPGEGTQDTSFQMIATDGELADSLTVTLTVVSQNDPPEISTPDTLLAVEDSLFHYVIEASDSEDSTLSFVYPAMPGWLTSQDSIVTGTPLEGDLDTVFTVVVSDGVLSDTARIILAVIPVNDPPVFISAPSDTATEDIEFTYVPIAADPEDSTLIYTCQWHPSWLSMRGDSLQGIPGNGVQDSSMQIIAFDGELRDTVIVHLKVNPVNDPPMILGIPRVEFPEDSLWTLDLDTLVTDIDDSLGHLEWHTELAQENEVQVEETSIHRVLPGKSSTRSVQSIRYGKKQNSTWKRIDEIPATRKLTGVKSVLTQEYSKLKIHRFQSSNQDTIEITIDPSTHIATFSASLNYSVDAIPVRFIVTDTSGAWDDDTTTVTVHAVNDPPVFTHSFGDTVILEDHTMQIPLSLFEPIVEDVDHSFAELTWSVSGTGHISVQWSADTLHIIPAPQWFGADTLGLVVSDGEFSDTTSLPIYVLPVNDPPVLDSIPDLSVAEEDTMHLVLNDFVTDIDDSLAWLEWEYAILSRSYENGIERNETSFASIRRDAVQLNQPADKHSERQIKKSLLSERNVLKTEPNNITTTDSVVITINPLTSEATIYGLTDFTTPWIPVRFIVRDSSDSWDDDTTGVSITPVNDPPHFTGQLPDTTFAEDTKLDIPVLNWQEYVEDVDTPDSTLQWRIYSARYISFEVTNEGIILTPQLNWFGYDTIGVEISDNEFQDSTTFIAEVTPVNDPPDSVQLLRPSSEYENTSDTIMAFAWSPAIDVEGDSVWYRIVLTDSAEFDTVLTVPLDSLEFSILGADIPRDTEVCWTVFAHDGIDSTAALNGPWWFTVATGVGIHDPLAGIPKTYVLEQNYPNPFNPVTIIRYGLPKQSDVSLDIFDIRGAHVVTIVRQMQEPGWYEVQWDGRSKLGTSVGSGMYFYVIRADEFRRVKKLVLIR